jgi:hypothetical protein
VLLVPAIRPAFGNPYVVSLLADALLFVLIHDSYPAKLRPNGIRRISMLRGPQRNLARRSLSHL